MAETIEWRPPRAPRRRGRIFLLAVLGVLVLSAGTALSYYVDALWFGSLGYGDVFWKTLRIQALAFSAFAGVTFAVLYGSFLAFKPDRLDELAGSAILINGQPLRLPVEPVIRLIALAAALVISLATGAGMMADWSTLALYWYGRPDALHYAGQPIVDPIFGRPLPFYLFTLPAWQLATGWLLTLALIACGVAIFFIVVTGGTRLVPRGRAAQGAAARPRPSDSFSALLLFPAWRVSLRRV